MPQGGAGSARETRTVLAAFAILTVVTGLVDAVSILALGQVFVANMTGNVIFLAFALAGVETFSAARSGVALAAFLLGALVTGLLSNRFSPVRTHRMAALVATALLPLTAGVLVLQLAPAGPPRDLQVIALLAVAMGMQNAMARRAGVADMTTTLITLTITGLASESSLTGGDNARWRRRVIAVALIFSGALVGALLVLDGRSVTALVLAALLVFGAVIALWRESEGEEEPGEAVE